MRVVSFACAALLAALVSAPAVGQEFTPNDPYPDPVPYHHDSGPRSSKAPALTTVHEHLVQVEDAAWIRVYFSAVNLAPGSTIRMTSLEDGEVQELDAAGMATWGNSSAYFNGEAVLVELVAAPGSKGNRFVIDRVASEALGAAEARGGAGECGICGSDDRVPSSELWTGRLAPNGCTGSIFNEQSCVVTAGHCVASNSAIHFNVPNSTCPNGINQQPPIADQFPITGSTFVNGGVGNDWGVLTTGTNNLGQTAFERYGQLRPISMTPASVGQTASLTGYGSDQTCSLNNVQQTSTGPISQVQGTFYTFSIDLRGGNSGSALIRSGAIIGIATHCPCPNIATRVDLPAFLEAREMMCPTDCNDNLMSDYCDTDCSALGGFCIVPGCGESLDCNNNDVPDECEGADLCPPQPNPMEFAVLPPMVLSDEAIEMEAATAFDDVTGADVEYFFMKTAGHACCGTSSNWQDSTTYVAGDLRANSSYSYKVKSRDAAAIPNETMLSTLSATASTWIEQPFEITLIDAQDTELTLMVSCQDLGDPNRCVGGAFTDLGLLPSGLFLEMTPLEGAGSDVWINSQTQTITGLTPGTAYSFRAKARNRVAVETAFSAPFVFNTTGGATCPTVPGDIDQDGMVLGSDIAGYTRAKLGLPPLLGEAPACADFGTGNLSDDTAAFVSVLLN